MTANPERPGALASFIDGLVEASTLGEKGAPMRDVALAYAHSGWLVLPCDPETKGPLIKGGFHGRSKEPAQVERWWEEHPTATVALVPADGGLIALDCDSQEALRAIGDHGLLPDGLLQALGTGTLDRHHGLVVATGGSSPSFEVLGVRVPRLHLYFRIPEGATPIAIPGVVTRFDKGYVVAPGSLGHGRYRLVGRAEPLPFNPIPGRTPAPEQTSAPTHLAALRAPDMHRLAEALTYIPNDENTDRAAWVAMAHAIKGAVGPERDGEGLELFFTWSARWGDGDDPTKDEQAYRSINPRNVRTGWESIWRQAAKHGFDVTLEIQRSAQQDFGEAEGASSPDPEERKVNTGYTLGELRQRPELLTPPVPAIPCLAWPGLKALLSAREKTGKSTFALAGAAAASRGASFLEETVPGVLVLWVTEEPLAITLQRAVAMQADDDRFVILPMEADPPAQLREAVERWKPQIVVIDTLYRFALIADENDAAGWLPVLRQFDSITRAGAALLLLVHATKAGKKGEYRGSTAIGGYVDVILAMTAPDAGRSRHVKAVGRIPVTDFRVDLGDDNTTFRLVGKRDADATARHAVLEHLRINGPTARTMLRRKLGMGDGKITAALQQLMAEHEVTLDQSGHYQVTKAEDDFAKDAA